MASGMEMLFKSMGINPAQIMQQAAGIGQAFTSIQERLARLEDNQRLIMMALNIPIEVSSEIMQLAHERSADYVEAQNAVHRHGLDRQEEILAHHLRGKPANG